MRRNAFAVLPFLVFAAVKAAPPAAAQGADAIGSAVAVVNLVTAELNRDTRSLKVGDAVRQYEKIEVGLDGSGEFKLEDDTKLALGPGSKLTLDKFVYDREKRGGNIIVNLAKGAFRFMTGIAAKPTYIVRTPVAAITVRGTIFDVFVMDDQTVWLLLHEGAIQVCNERGQCNVLDEPGKLMRVLSDGRVGAPVRWASLPGRNATPFARAFPFVIKAPSIDPKPVLTEAAVTDGDNDGGIIPPVIRPKPPRTPDYSDPPRSKPPKKVETKSPPKKDPPKTRTAGTKKSDYQEQIVTGMDIAIGIGGGMGRRGGGRPMGGGGKPPGSYGGNMPR